MHSLSIFGTSSDAGKSTFSFALTYLLHKKGISVAPFKAQNVSNNSVVCDVGGGEIAIPQAFAAEAIGLKTRCAMNPVLLKSGGKNKAHVIINGKSTANKDVWGYYRDIKQLKPVVKKAFKSLQKEFACIVAEGAGSPVELNLMQKDLSNIYIAKEFNTKIILVADIERGGVFASIYGVYHLLPKRLRKNIIGVVINKFRGDRAFFDEGVRIIEHDFGLKVLGVLPYTPFNLGFEDSASLMNYQQDISHTIIKVAIIALPHMSNFTDFEPLIADGELDVRFVTSVQEAMLCDMLIVPGSKLVVEDLGWLQAKGFSSLLQDKDRHIVAICGGYEMMFETLVDEYGIESSLARYEGFGRFRGEVHFQKEKVVQKGWYNLLGIPVEGYEIHNGIAKKRAKRKKRLFGTFVHGIFENDALRYKLFHKVDKRYKGYCFKSYKQERIASFCETLQRHLDLNTIIEKISL